MEVNALGLDSHHQFLPLDHPYRRNKDAFFKNQVEKSQPPLRLSGDDIWENVSDLPKITKVESCTCPGFGIIHNWTKQTIFWKLPYWKNNLIRHNLDVMHIEKNVFDIKDKTKDNIKARMDLKEYYQRKELEL